MDYRFEFFVMGTAFGTFMTLGLIGLVVAAVFSFARSAVKRSLRGR